MGKRGAWRNQGSRPYHETLKPPADMKRLRAVCVRIPRVEEVSLAKRGEQVLEVHTGELALALRKQQPCARRTLHERACAVAIKQLLPAFSLFVRQCS